VNLLSAQPKSAPPQIFSGKSEKKVIYAHFAARDEISKVAENNSWWWWESAALARDSR
jgi:hypothetical protein